MNAWTPTSTGTGTPAARDTHTAVWTGAAMIVWGGWDGFDAFGSGSRYNPSSDTWSPTAGGPQGRLAHTALWTGSEMIVWGGESVVSGISAGRLDSGSRYNPGANAYGISVDNQTSETLIEKNVVYYLNAGVILGSSGPGNVIGYNFTDRMYGSAYPDAGWLMADLIANHCAHPFMALHEGNMSS